MNPAPQDWCIQNGACKASLDAKRDPLVEFDAVVPWDEFRPMLERIWRKPEAARKSRARCKP
jgi:IS5 family transposase